MTSKRGPPPVVHSVLPPFRTQWDMYRKLVWSLQSVSVEIYNLNPYIEFLTYISNYRGHILTRKIPEKYFLVSYWRYGPNKTGFIEFWGRLQNINFQTDLLFLIH